MNGLMKTLMHLMFVYELEFAFLVKILNYNNNTITLTIGTYSCITSGIYGVAAVFATITMVVTVICLALYLKFTKLEDVRM